MTTRRDNSRIIKAPTGTALTAKSWLTEAPHDAAGLARALGDIARARGMTKVARAAGLSRESLYKALRRTGNPSLDTVLRVAKAVGVRLRAEAA